ncbi:hypothetical protein HanRHA438_Chr17g0819771 [Helianthus annuus]|nr:hypothetical protein HanRHA438_Chr17g0819771 [Helianthus annuus]
MFIGFVCLILYSTRIGFGLFWLSINLGLPESLVLYDFVNKESVKVVLLHISYSSMLSGWMQLIF